MTAHADLGQKRDDGKESLAAHVDSPDFSMPPVIDTKVLFGPLGEEAYARNAPAYPNDPTYAINKIKERYGPDGDAAATADRKAMWSKYEELTAKLAADSDVPVLDTVYSYLRENSSLAAKDLGNSRAGLGLHLKEITEFSTKFFLDEKGASRFPALLTDREAALFAQVAAPLHDSLKYLGSHKAQIMPDHEVMTAELVRNTFEGKTVILNGKPSKLTAEDVAFVASVIGDHENIEKEKGRSDLIKSTSSIERAKALFFVADVLTGTIVPGEGSGSWKIDFNQLDKRFVDLYFRHIDPSGKIFRPEWGASAINDLGSTFIELEKHGLKIEGAAQGESADQTLRRAALLAIDRVYGAEKKRWEGIPEGAKPEKYLTQEQLAEIAKAIASLS